MIRQHASLGPVLSTPAVHLSGGSRLLLTPPSSEVISGAHHSSVHFSMFLQSPVFSPTARGLFAVAPCAAFTNFLAPVVLPCAAPPVRLILVLPSLSEVCPSG